MDSELLLTRLCTLGVSDTDAFNMVVNEEIEMWVFDFGQALMNLAHIIKVDL